GAGAVLVINVGGAAGVVDGVHRLADQLVGCAGVVAVALERGHLVAVVVADVEAGLLAGGRGLPYRVGVRVIVGVVIGPGLGVCEAPTLARRPLTSWALVSPNT